MWKFDEYGNAQNDETGEKLYWIKGTDGVLRVYHTDPKKTIGTFREVKDAVSYIKNFVK